PICAAGAHAPDAKDTAARSASCTATASWNASPSSAAMRSIPRGAMGTKRGSTVIATCGSCAPARVAPAELLDLEPRAPRGGSGFGPLPREHLPVFLVHLLAQPRPLAEVPHAPRAAVREVLMVRQCRLVVLRLLVADGDAEQLFDEVDVVHTHGVVVGE